MPKTITVRLPDESYEQIADHAEADKRSISNFIEYAVEQYIKQSEFTDDEEMLELLGNEELMERLKRGSKDAKKGKGKFIKKL
jgi:predicted DNA-binding protein